MQAVCSGSWPLDQSWVPRSLPVLLQKQVPDRCTQAPASHVPSSSGGPQDLFVTRWYFAEAKWPWQREPEAASCPKGPEPAAGGEEGGAAAAQRSAGRQDESLGLFHSLHLLK